MHRRPPSPLRRPLFVALVAVILLAWAASIAGAAPAPPVISGGPENGTAVNQPPSYTITAEAGATIAWSLSREGAGEVLNGAGESPDLSSIDLPNGANDGDYTLVATATDAEGTSGASGDRTFTLDNVAPAAPVISGGPVNGSAVNTPPSYSIAAEQGATITWSLGGPSPLAGTGASPGLTSVDDAGGDNDGDYALVATATDAAGNPSGPSDARTFTLDNVAPVVTFVTPFDGGTADYGSPLTADFSCTDPEPGSGVAPGSCVSANGISPGDPISTAPPQGEDWSRMLTVDAVDLAGNRSTPAPSVSFEIVDTAPPGTPPLLGPADGVTTNDTTPTFWWGPADPEGGSPIVGYTLVVEGPDDRVVDGLTDASQYTVPDLDPLPEGDYEWYVEAEDQGGNTATSPTASFTIDISAPGAPTFTATPQGSSTDATPAFSWSAPGAASYEWQLLSGVPPQILQSGATSATSIELGALAPGIYNFRVRAIDAVGNKGDFNLPVAFTILAPPDPPAPAPAPSGGSTGGGDTTSTPAPSPAPAATAAAATTTASTPDPSKPAPSTKPTKIKPATSNATRLTPRAGVALKTVRPTLRWRKVKGATVYNVQVFRMNGTKFTKVLSSFPRTNKLRLPKGRLARGQRYVWRVWPFVGNKSSKKPTGVSYFDVAPLPKTRVRLKAPRASQVRTRRPLAVRWTKSTDATRYTVDVRRGKTTVFRRTTKGTRLTVPASKLRKAGTYRVRVRITGSKTHTAIASTWALGTVKARAR